MPVYRLEPIVGQLGHSAWRTSEVPPSIVWVRAENPDYARQKLHMARLPTTRPTQAIWAPNGPWTNAALVSCVEDHSHEVPEGVPLIANGKIRLGLS